MSFPKLLVIVAGVIFSIIAIAAFFKSGSSTTAPKQKLVPQTLPIEVELEQDVRVMPQTEVVQASPQPAKSVAAPIASASPTPVSAPALPPAPTSESIQTAAPPQPITPAQPEKPLPAAEKPLPTADRIAELFNIDGPKLPIVETVTYKSRAAWQKGRPAWLADYARYYQTSRHFIARSLNGKPDYFKQDLAENARFNVLRKDKNVRFYLLVDLSRCKMWFYYDDLDAKERVLLKTYQVGVGRIDGSKASGFLSPIGKYTLGNKVAIYKPKMMGHHNGEPVEMIEIFGTRWIPFDVAVGKCTAPAKGLGIHGLPWTKTASGEKAQDRSSLGKYQSDGCIRLASEDIEEIFSIIITKPAAIELVKDFHDVKQ